MYKGQYLVFKDKIKSAIAEFKEYSFLDFTIYAHQDLNITIGESAQTSVALIGFIIDPFNPDKTNEDIISSLVSGSKTTDGFFQSIHPLSGRFVLMAQIQDQMILAGDACHYRQIFFSQSEGHFSITSSPKLFLDSYQLESLIGEEKQALINHPLFKNRENSWYGNGCEDDRLVKLLPNHYLDLQHRQAKRMPVPVIDKKLTEDQILVYVSRILKGTYQCLTSRYKLMQALTSGWDTRVLLAASKDYKDKIEYFVFDRQDKKGPKSADARTASALAQQLDLKFQVFNPEPLTDEFLNLYTKEHVLPRILPKTANIQHYWKQGYSKDFMSVSGNCAGIYKHPYGYGTGRTRLDQLLVFSGYHNEVPFIRKQIEQWYHNSKRYAKELGIPILELFNWEQRVGNWGSVFPYEQDFALEEVAPLNNRMLLLHLMMVDPSKRISPKFLYIRRLISYLWDETLSEPINQDINTLWSYIKGSTQFKYLSLKLRFILMKRNKVRKQVKEQQLSAAESN
jgi:hypothetical protein